MAPNKVWTHFTRSGQRQAECNACRGTFPSVPLYVMVNHLREEHGVELPSSARATRRSHPEPDQAEAAAASGGSTPVKRVKEEKQDDEGNGAGHEDRRNVTNTGANVSVFNCCVCFERFDAEGRRPKFLECGHTVCLSCTKACIRDAQLTCPMDRQVFAVADPEALKDNFQLLNCVPGSGEDNVFYWCLECSEDAGEECMRNHTVCSLKVARRMAVEDAMNSLERDASQHGKVLELMRGFGAKIQASVDRHCAALSATQAVSQGAVNVATQSLELAEPQWVEAKEALQDTVVDCKERSRQLEEVHNILKMTGTYTLTVQDDEPNPTVYTAEGTLSGEANGEAEATFRHLMILLKETRALKLVQLSFVYRAPLNSVLRERQYSPAHYCRNLSWRLAVERYEKESAAYLSAHLHARKETRGPWGCYARYDISLLSHHAGIEPHSVDSSHIFSPTAPKAGRNRFLSIKDLFDPEYGYVNGNEIVFEVTLKTRGANI